MTQHSGAPRQPTELTLPAEWMTRSEALNALNIRERTLQDWVKQSFIRAEVRSVVGRRPERVYHAADIRKLIAEGGPARRRLTPNTHLGVARMSLPAPAALPPIEAPPPPVETLWVSLEEAAAISGLSENYLKGQIGIEKLHAVRGGPGGRWRIRRTALAEFNG